MRVVSICFKCFQMFHTYVYKCFIWMLHMHAMVFKCFSRRFRKCFRHCFKCFICIPLYITTVVSGCFKSESMCYTWDVREKRSVTRMTSKTAWVTSETAQTTTRALVHELDTLGARSLTVRARSGHWLLHRIPGADRLS